MALQGLLLNLQVVAESHIRAVAALARFEPVVREVVTALPPGPTDAPVLAKFGLDPKTTSIKLMKVDHSVAEGLNALAANRAILIPGRMNRIVRAILPATVIRSMMMKLFEKMPRSGDQLASGVRCDIQPNSWGPFR